MFRFYKRDLAPVRASLPPYGEFFIGDVKGAIEYINGYPRIDWSKVSAAMERFSGLPVLSQIWTELAAQWLGLLGTKIGPQYGLYESERLLLLSGEDENHAGRVLEFADMAYQVIENGLNLSAEHARLGKHPILLLASKSPCQEYVKYFAPKDVISFGNSS